MTTQNIIDAWESGAEPYSKSTLKRGQTSEIRDTTGNILRPGMYGYHEKVCERCDKPLYYSSLAHCATCHRELWTEQP